MILTNITKNDLDYFIHWIINNDNNFPAIVNQELVDSFIEDCDHAIKDMNIDDFWDILCKDLKQSMSDIFFNYIKQYYARVYLPPAQFNNVFIIDLNKKYVFFEINTFLTPEFTHSNLINLETLIQVLSYNKCHSLYDKLAKKYFDPFERAVNEALINFKENLY